MIHSYPTVYQIGHKAIANLFDGEVTVQEKVDGSQISFGIIDGELQVRSKNKQLILDAPEKMFANAVAIIRALPLSSGLVYRGEYLEKPKHNTLTYARTPNNNIILYDVDGGGETYWDYNRLSEESRRLGLEVVPEFYRGNVKSMEQFKDLLERESILGGSKIEGVVVKNYSQFTQEKKVAMGKYVREEFKEENAKDWRARNPTGKDIIQDLVMRFASEPRWKKAVQHLRDAGMLDGSPKDIGLLIREVPADIRKEHEQEIKDILFNHFWKTISRGVTHGLPEWYKEELLKQQFAGDTDVRDSSN